MITSRRGGCWHFLREFNSWLIPAIFLPFALTFSFHSAAEGSLDTCWGWRELCREWRLRASPLPCPSPSTPGCSLIATGCGCSAMRALKCLGRGNASCWLQLARVSVSLNYVFGQVSLRTEAHMVLFMSLCVSPCFAFVPLSVPLCSVLRVPCSCPSLS